MPENSQNTDAQHADEQVLKDYQAYAGRLKDSIGKFDIVLIFMFILYSVILMQALLINLWAIPGILLSIALFDYIYAIYQNGKESNYLSATLICETMKQNLLLKKSLEEKRK